MIFDGAALHITHSTITEHNTVMPLLTVEHLSVAYDSRGTSIPAVDDVSFAIAPAEVVALVGESGSGKTSVALAVTKLLPPPAHISGRVALSIRSTEPNTLAGEDVSNLLDAADSTLRMIRGGSIAYVFQDPATTLNPVLTIGEQLREVVTWHTALRGREAREAVIEWLDRVGIATPEDRLEAYPHEFSGGMQQRVCIAMALASRPALLIADEPTSALDVTVQVQILRLLRDLQRSLSMAILLISHDLTVVERLAHRIGVMQKGRLVEFGAAAQVLQQPAHPYTQALLRCRAALTLPFRQEQKS